MEKWSARQGEVSLEAGDTLVVYSDGITEARDTRDSRDEEFGEALLADSLRRHAGVPLKDLPALILADVERFAGSEPQDDRTVVALRGRY